MEGLADVHSIFLPCVLRGRNVYEDLRTHLFTHEEKLYLLETVIPAAKENEQLSATAVFDRYNINQNTGKSWMGKYRNGKFLHNTCGKPCSLDEESKTIIMDTCQNNEDAKKPLSIAETNNLIQAQANATKERRNQPNTQLHERTVTKLKGDIGITTVKPQVTSQARLKACSDLRMSYSMWIMLRSFIYLLNPSRIWNFDATQLNYTRSEAEKRVCIVKGKKRNSPTTTVGDSSLGIGVKWMHFANAAGEVGPLVFLIAISSFGPDDLEVFEVPGLDQHGLSDRVGYVVFCETRAGNTNFFDWFVKTIVFPTVKNVSDRISQTSLLQEDACNPLKGFVTCDGEAIQLDPLFTESVHNRCKDDCVILGKISASCSGIHQPSDVSPLFRSVKSKLKYFIRHGQYKENAIENRIMEKLLQSTNEKVKNITADQKDKIVRACNMCMTSIQETITPGLIKQGFEWTGQYPLCMKTIVKRCYTDVTDEQLELMKNSTEKDVQFVRQHGYLSEEEMDKSGLPKVIDESNSTPRDERPSHNQRALVISHPETRNRHMAYMNRNAVPVGVSESILDAPDNKEVQKAMKLVNAHNNRIKQKNDEAVRKASLTPQQKIEEAREKKRKSEENKRQKEEKLQRSLRIIEART